MAREFNLYGKKIVISDDYDTFNNLKKTFVSEAEKAASKFINTYWNKYGTIEELLDNGYKDGMRVISDVIQDVVISQIFMKEKIYDMDINRFFQIFYNCEWGETLQELINSYNELSEEINSLSGKLLGTAESYKRYANYVKDVHDAELSSGATLKEALSTQVFGKWGMSESHRSSHEFWSNALEKKRQETIKETSDLQSHIKKLEDIRKNLYDSARTPLRNEIYSCVINILPACLQAMSEHGVVDPNLIPMLNKEKVSRASSIVNNMAHMNQNEVIELLPDLVLSIPYNSDLYEKLLLRLGDHRGELVQVANFFGVSGELLTAKEQELKKLLEKVKPDFYRTKESSAKARQTLIKQANFYGYPPEKLEAMLGAFVSKIKNEASRNPENEVSNSFFAPLIIGIVIAVVALMNEEVGVAVFWGILFGIGSLFQYNKVAEERVTISQEVSKAQQLLDNWAYDYSADKISKELLNSTDNLPYLQSTYESSTSSLPAKEVKTEELKSVNQEEVNQEEENELSKVSKLVAHQISKNYEPIPGFETEALIKRAYLFLEDGEFDNAGRYFEQALNQDPEDARIYVGQLILTYQVHTIDELIEGLSTPLEDEKLFQRALRFANDDYKKQLENYAQSQKEKIEAEIERIRLEKEAKLEAERLAKEAEQERIRAEQERLQAEEERKKAEAEARKEKIYQEVLALKEKASTISDFNEILRLANSIRSYKDTEKIYEEINQALKTELKYQEVLVKKRVAKSSVDWEIVIKHLEALDGYKDSDELLSQAQEALNDAEELEKQQRKKKIIGTVVLIVLVFSGFGIYKYRERAERLAEEQRIEEARIAREKAIEEAKIAKENIMIAFFEGRYDDITSTDNYYVNHNPAIINMLAHIDYERAGKDYDKLNKQAEDLRKKSPSSSKDDYEEAIKLALKYRSSIPAYKFLGDCYLNGWGSEKNANKAFQYFNLPAESGDIYSQIALASIYENVLNDKNKATELYQKLADSGNAEAQNKLRLFREKQKAKEEEERKAEAQRVYSSAQASEVNGNFETALTQYRHALELGHPEAQKRITAIQDKQKSELEIKVSYAEAEQYLKDKNYSQAFEIFRRLANAGYAPAQDKLAWMYQNGWGVDQSYAYAVSWFRKAAEQGNTEALASMGLMYYRGWGVRQDYDAALLWYRRAAAKGSEVAERRINSIILLKANKHKIASIENKYGFPIAGKIFAETLSVRQSPNTKSRVIKTLKTGHPVSISKASESDDDYWFYIKTASGTEGWVLGGYVTVIDRDLTYEESSNRRYSLPKSGYVRTSSQSSFLNLRNIPAIEGSKVVEKLDNGERFTAYEVFAGDTMDWYRIRTSYSSNEGWVSGKYIELNY